MSVICKIPKGNEKTATIKFEFRSPMLFGPFWPTTLESQWSNF